MQLQDVGRERGDDAVERLIVGVDAQRGDLRPAARLRAERRAPDRRPTWRGLLAKNTKPTMSAPAASAASSVAAVERPQILTVGAIGASFGQTRRGCQRRFVACRLRKASGVVFGRCRFLKDGDPDGQAAEIVLAAAMALWTCAGTQLGRGTRAPARPTFRPAGPAIRSERGRNEFRWASTQRSRRPEGGLRPDYNYSAANKNSGLIWDEATLTKYLQPPQAIRAWHEDGLPRAATGRRRRQRDRLSQAVRPRRQENVSRLEGGGGSLRRSPPLRQGVPFDPADFLFRRRAHLLFGGAIEGDNPAPLIGQFRRRLLWLRRAARRRAGDELVNSSTSSHARR